MPRWFLRCETCGGDGLRTTCPYETHFRVGLPRARCWGAEIVRGELRTWTDVSGKYEYEAELVALQDGVVKLRLADGRTANIPLEKLSEADRVVVGRELGAGEGRPALVMEESPKPRERTGTAMHFSKLLERPGKKDKMLALEGLGKIRIESLDPSEQAEGLELLRRVEGFGDAGAWDEASSTIARYYSDNLMWREAEQAWFEYVSDKNTGRYSAEAWYTLGLAREKLAGDDVERLSKALSAYVFCMAKYKNQIRFSSAAWRRAAVIEHRRGQTERARRLVDAMVDEIGGAVYAIAPEKRTDDMKWANIELNIAKGFREKW